MELIVTIVVIGILASITVVAYNGMQSRARDSARDQASAQLIKAFQMWVSYNNKTKATDMPMGWNGGGEGYPLLTTTGASDVYNRPNAADILSAAGLLAVNFTASLPPGPGGAKQSDNIMLYNCTNNRTILLWYYENSSAQSDQDYLKTVRDCKGDNKDYINDSTAYTNQLYANYKMRKAKIF